ncbi:MAG: NADH-quinone oxidoreductase subunit N [Chloroflexota bacterium]
MNLQILSPEIILCGFALLVILLDLGVKQKGVLAGLSIAGLIVSALAAVSMWGVPKLAAFGGALVVDQFAIFFKLIIAAAAILVILASQDYAGKFARFKGEYYALILLSAVGMMLLVGTTDLIAIYVALELSSISLYVLAGFLKDQKSTEAGLKYLLLGAIASAVLLYGMAMVFGLTGTTRLGEIAMAMQSGQIAPTPALFMGLVLLASGFGFKIACVPFQMWVPDVYEGAPTPVTAYLSVASKAAGFGVIARVFFTAFSLPMVLSIDWGILFAILSAITMTVGNVMALAQKNVKRLLGYSSIAQAGYLMVGLASIGMASANDVLGRSGLLFFMASYALTNLGAFIAIIAISQKINSDEIDDYAGMGKRSPLLASALSLCLFSLTGLPPTAGLIAKVIIFNGAVQSGLLWLVIVAVLNTCISAYYYLKVVKVMWFNPAPSEEKVTSKSWTLATALTLACLGVLVFGIIPGPLASFAQAAIKILVP